MLFRNIVLEILNEHSEIQGQVVRNEEKSCSENRLARPDSPSYTYSDLEQVRYQVKIQGGQAESEQGESVGRGLDDGRWVGFGVSHSILGSF